MKKDIKLKEKIERYLNGELGHSEADEMWAELLASPEEFDYLQTLASLKEMKREGSLDEILAHDSANNSGNIIPIKQKRSTFRIASGMKRYLVAASLLIMGVAVLFQITSDDFLSSEQLPIAMIEFEIERSTDELNQTERDLQRAITHSVSGDLQTAFEMLDSFDENEDLSDSERVSLKFVLGSIYYNNGAYEQASALFEMMLSDVVTEKKDIEKSIWYLANAQIHLNQYEKAVENIHHVIEMDGAFMRPAKRMLATLEKESMEE